MSGAVEFLRAALADGSRPKADIEREAAEAGITGDELRDGRRRLNLTFSGSPWQMRLHQAGCIVCDVSTDVVETEHGLPLHPGCPSPIRTWEWKRRRTDGKRGRETVRVSHRADTWRTGANERNKPPGWRHLVRMETCSSVLERMSAGRPKCDSPVVWKVTVVIGSRSRTTVWCDADLPALDRPFGQLGGTP